MNFKILFSIKKLRSQSTFKKYSRIARFYMKENISLPTLSMHSLTISNNRVLVHLFYLITILLIFILILLHNFLNSQEPNILLLAI